MNRKAILISTFALAYLIDNKSTCVHSFQLQGRPKTKYNFPSQRNVGYINPRDWSDVNPHAETVDLESTLSKTSTPTDHKSPLTPIESMWTKYKMVAYIAHMCAFLPISLMPTYLQTKFGLLTKSEAEHQALQVGQKCAQTLLQWIPFMNVGKSLYNGRVENCFRPSFLFRYTIQPNFINVRLLNSEITPYIVDEPKPAILVSNHVSMLDTFVFLAADEKLRGKNRRPIKTVYWKGLDSNPICKILFGMAGFISVDMANNGSGNPNEYNRASFKQMLKDTHKAIEEGFDILVLPEGQLNPTPEKGLQPVMSGAYALAKSSKRPIQMIALHGCHNLWHADESIGMTPVGEDVKIKAFPPTKRKFKSAEEFKDAFSAVVGTFGSTGHDASEEEIDYWLNSCK